jgi:hypothetical protein
MQTTVELNMYIMKQFKHSGALGDLIYSLPIVKHFGPGEFYLHLNQMDWIGQHYYGALPTPFHQGRMTQGDFEYMKTFMEAQEYITKFDVLDPKVAEITHNLDRFRPPFVQHPTNYLMLYSEVFGLTLDEAKAVSSQPWLTVPKPKRIEGKTTVINRTRRWIPPTPSGAWDELKSQVEDSALFVGLPDEYQAFRKETGWDIAHYATDNMLDLASVIAGAEIFVGNQSQAYALAVGLGVPEIWCESRVDMPLERNECYFPLMTNIQYF